MTLEQNPDDMNPPTRANSAGSIERTLDSLRGKIRGYVFIQGIMLAAIWLCISFWIALALDYAPVLLGYPEMSRFFRAVLLVVMLGGLAWILIQRIWLPMRKKISRPSLAMLLENRFPELGDALATSVENSSLVSDSEESPRAGDIVSHDEIMTRVKAEAESRLESVSLQDVFNFRPVILTALISLVLVSSVGWFAVEKGSDFTTAFRRLYLLDDKQWPRECHVQMVGVRVKHVNQFEGIPEMNDVREFSNGSVVVGRSSKLVLLVKSELPDTNARGNRRLPERCEMIWKTNGVSGRVPLGKVGGARDGFQSYATDQEVLEGLNEDLTFFVRADDHRIGPFEIKVKDPPVLVTRTADCVYPNYLVDEFSSRFTPRTVSISDGFELPAGTKTTINVRADRALKSIYGLGAGNELLFRFDQTAPGQDEFELANYDATDLKEFALVLCDEDGVFSKSIDRIRINARKDQPPRVNSFLRGIGVAVTPEALLPVMADISDDHELKTAWIELSTPVSNTSHVQTPATGESEFSIDLRSLRISGDIPRDLPIEGSAEIVLTVLAQDHFDLDSKQNIGQGTKHPLQIVSSDKLLRMLERDEAGQRLRLEQIVREMRDAESYILRAGTARTSLVEGFEPGDETSHEAEEDIASWDLRKLFLQRAKLQTQKSVQEIQELAFAFDNIRLQLVNNRIDAEDRKDRLKNKVAGPLRSIANESMEQLVFQLSQSTSEIEQMIQSIQTESELTDVRQRVDEASLQASAQVEVVIAELLAVLDSLLKFETQNELLDIVRNLLEEQKSLQKRTEALRNQEAFDDIFK